MKLLYTTLLNMELNIKKPQLEFKLVTRLTSGTAMADGIIERGLAGYEDEESAYKELTTELEQRVEAAKRGDISERTVEAIFQEAIDEAKPEIHM